MPELGSDPLIGRTIAGKFVIESLIGAGAMGAVYKAHHKTLDKTVALKVLHVEHARDTTFVARFQREAKAASRIDHPNSMRVIDFGEEPDGTLYIAMEFLEGTDLFTMLLREWPLSDERIVDILSQVLAALAVGHAQGVVHRDLKPENVMILRGMDDEGKPRDLVKVCDFGIAKIIEREERKNRSDPQRAVTTQGIVVGTPEYMSPEQGKGELLDARSDLYSVGVMLYQLLAGRVPFEAESAIGVVLKHVTEEPEPPTKVNPLASKRLEGICLRAMKKDREERYASAREMRADLRAAVAAPASSRPDDIEPAPVSFGRASTEQAMQPIAITGAIKPLPIRTESKVTPAGTAAVATPIIDVNEARRGRSFALPAVLAIVALVIGAGGTVAYMRQQGRAARIDDAPTSAIVRAEPAPTTSAIPQPSPVDTRPAPTSTSTSSAPPLASTTKKLPPTRAPLAMAPSAASASVSALPDMPDPVAPEAPTITAVDAPPAPTPPPPPADTATAIVAAMPPPPPFDPAKGRVAWSVSGAGGGATPNNVAHAIGRAAGSWTSCYQAGLRARGRRVEGSATLRLACDADGRVVGAQAAGFELGDVLACIQGSSTGFTIPNADTGEAWATIAISFKVAE